MAGEAGAGKSVFVRRFASSVEGPAGVLVGACDPLSTPRALGPLLDIAAQTGGELDRQLREGAPPAIIFRSLQARLVSAPRPAVVVLEDVHWADEATLDLLRFLGRRVESLRSLVVATYRDDEVGPSHPLRIVIGDLATSPDTRHLTLQSLSEAAVRHLARGTDIDPVELHRRSGGNPFYVTEVLAGGAQGVPSTIRDAVLARVARLSPPARSAVEAAAAIGLSADPSLLAAVLGDGTGAVDECVSKGVLLTDGAKLRFRHELVRDAIAGAISPAALRQLHGRVLAALEAAPELRLDPATLAHHAEASGNGPGTLKYAREAASRAVELKAHSQAADQFSRALRHSVALPADDRATLLEEHARECVIAGRFEAAIESYSAAIQIRGAAGHRLKEGELLARLSRAYYGTNRRREAEEVNLASLSILESLPAGSELAYAYWHQSHLRMLNRDLSEAIEWGDRAVAAAERSGDRATLIAAQNTLGTAMLLAGDEAGRTLLERSLESAREAGLDDLITLAHSQLGSLAGELYRFPEADRHLQAGIAFCATRDIEAYRRYLTAWQALSHLYQGRWREAAECAVAAQGSPASPDFSRLTALIALGRLRVRRGDPDAWTVLDEALAHALRSDTLQRIAPARAARAESAWLAGDPERTRVEAAAALDLAVQHRHAWFTGELAYWCWKAGQAGPVPPFAAKPFALQIAGSWKEAAAVWRELNCPYETARALAEGDDPRALREALGVFDALGARPAATETARRLRELGVRGIRRGPRRTTRSNPAGLTDRELDVLRLVCEGMSNPAIAERLGVSPRTVDHHVSSLLAKLEVRSRAQAIGLATRLGIHPQDR